MGQALWGPRHQRPAGQATTTELDEIDGSSQPSSNRGHRHTPRDLEGLPPHTHTFNLPDCYLCEKKEGRSPSERALWSQQTDPQLDPNAPGETLLAHFPRLLTPSACKAWGSLHQKPTEFPGESCVAEPLSYITVIRLMLVPDRK